MHVSVLFSSVHLYLVLMTYVFYISILLVFHWTALFIIYLDTEMVEELDLRRLPLFHALFMSYSKKFGITFLYRSLLQWIFLVPGY